jgi:hypothetical protein
MPTAISSATFVKRLEPVSFSRSLVGYPASDVVSGDLHRVALKKLNPPLTLIIRCQAGLERMLPDEVVDID